MFFKLTTRYTAALALIAVLFMACKPKQNMVYMSNDNFKEEVSRAKYQGLHIQEGDVLEIVISAFDEIAVKPFNKSTMTQTGADSGSGGSTGAANSYTVTSSGYISMPVLGNVYCKGMTKQQLQEDLEQRLKRYLTDPMVTVRLTNFNISVLGEVKSPGQKTSPTEKLNVFQALALAGDITDGGNKTNVKLIRSAEDGGQDQVVSLDLSEASIVSSPYYYLQQNDILYVEPDRNRQIEVNSNASVDKILKYSGFALGILTLIITLTRK